MFLFTRWHCSCRHDWQKHGESAFIYCYLSVCIDNKIIKWNIETTELSKKLFCKGNIFSSLCVHFIAPLRTSIHESAEDDYAFYGIYINKFIFWKYSISTISWLVKVCPVVVVCVDPGMCVWMGLISKTDHGCCTFFHSNTSSSTYFYFFYWSSEFNIKYASVCDVAITVSISEILSTIILILCCKNKA